MPLLLVDAEALGEGLWNVKAILFDFTLKWIEK
jgi:hypothetical protein